MAIILENKQDIFRFKSYLFNYPQKCTYKTKSISGDIEEYSILEGCGIWYIGEIYLNRIQKRTWYGKKYLYHDCILLGKFNFNNEIFIANTNDKTYLNIIKNIIEKIPPISHFDIYPKYNIVYWQSNISYYRNLLYNEQKGYYDLIMKFPSLGD